MRRARPVDLRLPLLLGDVAVELVGLVDPDARIAIGVLGADEDVVAALWAEVDPGVAVGGVVAVLLEVEVRRRGHVVDLVAQRAGR
jgi:hypothetical protein